MSEGELLNFIRLGLSFGLVVALAGSIDFPHLELLGRLNPDIIGVRGIVCGGDRSGTVRADLVEKLKMVKEQPQGLLMLDAQLAGRE